jgi:hypothetical protein
MKKSRQTPARKRPTKRARSAAPRHQPAKLSAAPGLTTIAIPRIGDYWPGQGGIFHGVMLGQNGKPDYALISVEKKHHQADTDFKAMQEYPKGLTIDGHKDFAMPTRKEQRVQFANAKPGQFDEAYYWSGEQSANASACAWYQNFDHGNQYDWPKDGRFRGCAVRRIPIR